MKALARVFCRYSILLALVLLAYTGVFYSFMFLITAYPLNLLLSVFYTSAIHFHTLNVESLAVELIPACIAVSAYVLLLILNFSVEMPAKKRLCAMLFSFALLLILNILRIFALTILLIRDFAYFQAVHSLFWYFLSTVFVAAIWFLSVYLFKIDKIPFYSDFMLLRKEAVK